MNNNELAIVTQIPWAAVITGLAGITGALGGSLLTNRYAERRWDKQVLSEAQKETKKLIREKGEAAFLALTRWSKEIYFFYSARLGFLQGAISGEQLDTTIREKVNSSTHGEVDVLISLYFPEFKSEINGVFKKLDECNSIFGLSESQKITKNEAYHKLAPQVVHLETEMECLIDKFCESLLKKIQ